MQNKVWEQVGCFLNKLRCENVTRDTAVEVPGYRDTQQELEEMVKIEELQRLFRFTSKGTMMTEFDDEIFLSFVEQITVLSRKEVVFELKCGLSLRERLVEP